MAIEAIYYIKFHIGNRKRKEKRFLLLKMHKLSGKMEKIFVKVIHLFKLLCYNNYYALRARREVEVRT